MALFGKKEKTEKKPVAAAKSVPISDAGIFELSHVIVKPRITEKATMHGTMGVYTFDVADTANKRQIAQAVRELYKVIPRMVRIVRVPSKRKRNSRTGKAGVKRGGKKAYVYLKRGETINLS